MRIFWVLLFFLVCLSSCTENVSRAEAENCELFNVDAIDKIILDSIGVNLVEMRYTLDDFFHSDKASKADMMAKISKVEYDSTLIRMFGKFELSKKFKRSASDREYIASKIILEAVFSNVAKENCADSESEKVKIREEALQNIFVGNIYSPHQFNSLISYLYDEKLISDVELETLLLVKYLIDAINFSTINNSY